MLSRALLTLIVAVGCVAAGFGIGWLLDGVAESRPLLTLFGTFVGLIVAIAVSWSRTHKAAR